MDENEEESAPQPYRAVKHNKWTFIALGVDLLAGVANVVAGTLEATTTAIGQYRQHKIHEEEFLDIVDRNY